MRYSIASPRKPIAADAAEIIVGFVGTLVIFFVVNLLMKNVSNTNNTLLKVVYLIISLSGLFLVPYFLVCFVGKYNHKNGSYLLALLGNILGWGVCLLTSFLILDVSIRFGRDIPYHALISGVSLILPSVGAAIGFNLKKEIKQ